MTTSLMRARYPGRAAASRHLYRSAAWLLGRHPRLARLAARIREVVTIEDNELSVDLDHLADVLSAVTSYTAAWENYERRHEPPDTDDEYDAWRGAGPKANDFAAGLSDFLVMSSGEITSFRLLATLATTARSHASASRTCAALTKKDISL